MHSALQRSELFALKKKDVVGTISNRYLISLSSFRRVLPMGLVVSSDCGIFSFCPCATLLFRIVEFGLFLVVDCHPGFNGLPTPL